jgi:hypothetical protein
MPLARLVALVLLTLPIAAYFMISNLAARGPSENAVRVANLDPRQMVSETKPRFLPTAVAAMPPETGPAAPQAAAKPEPQEAPEQVRVSAGRAGATLRSEPASGRPLATLRDGQVLEVRERVMTEEGEWLRVHAETGAEGWVFSALLEPVQ